MSFKVWVLAHGDKEPTTNGLAFPTADSAHRWGEGLLWRWTGAQSFTVRESDEPVNVNESGAMLPAEEKA